MPNSLEYVRRKVNAKRTKENKGLEMTIKIVAYDNGIVNVNGNPIGRGRWNQWLSAARFILQLLNEFEYKVSKARRDEMADFDADMEADEAAEH